MQGLSNTGDTDNDIQERIIKYLASQEEAVKTLAITQALGLTNSQTINSALYSMRNEGILVLASEQPPLWKLIRVPTEMDKDNNLSTYFPGNSGGYSSQLPTINVMNDSPTPVDMNMIGMESCDTSESSIEPAETQASNSNAEYLQSDDSSIQSELGDVKPVIDCSQSIISNSTNDAEMEVSGDSNQCTDVFSDASVIDKTTYTLPASPGSSISMPILTPQVSASNMAIKIEQTSSCSTRSTPNLSPQKCDISELDKVLKVIYDSKLRMLKTFVIKSESRIDSLDKVKEILMDAKKYNYVKEQDGVFILQEKGDKYVKSKFPECDTSVQSVDKFTPQTKITRTGEGTPKTPFEVLKLRNPSYSSSSSDISSNSLSNINCVRPSLTSLSRTGLQSMPMSVNSMDVTGTLQGASNIPSLLSLPRMGRGLSNTTPFTGLGRGRGMFTNRNVASHLMPNHSANFIPKTTEISEQSFQPPPPPVDMLRKQLSDTEISTKGVGRGTTMLGSMPPVISSGDAGNTRMNNYTSIGGGSSLCQPEPLSLIQSSFNQKSQSVFPSQPQSLPVMSTTSFQPAQHSGPSSLDLELTKETLSAVSRNPVSALMEYAQSRHKVARIEVISQTGPSHRPK